MKKSRLLSFHVGRVKGAVPGYHRIWEVWPGLSKQEHRIHHTEGVDSGAWLAREYVNVAGNCLELEQDLGTEHGRGK